MEKELLFSITKKDFEITYFNGTGPGGQHKNKHANCVRLKHIETGIITTGQDQKNQHTNLKNAFIRMTKHPHFKIWLNKKIQENILDKDEQEKEKIVLNEKVNEMMQEKYLKIEYM